MSKLIRGQKLVCVPVDDTVCCFMQRLSQHQSVGQQITNDPLGKVFTRNTARSWWIALDTMKNLKIFLKKLDCGVSRNSRNCADQQKAEVNKLELRSQLGRMWEKLVLEYLENEMRLYLICPTSDGEPFHPE